jgi:hypothetical protein
VDLGHAAQRIDILDVRRQRRHMRCAGVCGIQPWRAAQAHLPRRFGATLAACHQLAQCSGDPPLAAMRRACITRSSKHDSSARSASRDIAVDMVALVSSPRASCAASTVWASEAVAPLIKAVASLACPRAGECRPALRSASLAGGRQSLQSILWFIYGLAGRDQNQVWLPGGCFAAQ